MKGLSYWIKSVPNIPTFQKLIGRKKFDVAIVGGGIVGLQTALCLKEQGKKVVVIEAFKVGQGSSGFSFGKITFPQRLPYTEFSKKIGKDTARFYAEMSSKGMELIQHYTTKYGIQCDLEFQNEYIYTCQKENVSTIIEEAKSASEVGVKLAFEKESPLPFEIKAGIMFENQIQFNPYAYCIGLANSINGNGCQIYEMSKVQSINGLDNPPSVATTEGDVFADCIILTGHFPIQCNGGHFPLMQPIKIHCIAAKLKGRYDNIKGGYTSIDDHSIISHQTTKNGSILILAGEEHKIGEYSSSGSEICYKKLIEYAKSNFPIKEVIAKWSSISHYPMDNLPPISLPFKGSKRVYSMSGINKFGLAIGVASSGLMSDIIMGKKDFKKLLNLERTIPKPFLKDIQNLQFKYSIHNQKSFVHFTDDKPLLNFKKSGLE